jgi:hypothetical protein
VSGWTSEELEQVGAAGELGLTVSGRTVTIWVVRVGDSLYVRSWRGTGGLWFRNATRTGSAHISADGVERDVDLFRPDSSVDDLVDDAYRTKYFRYLDSYTAHMVAPQARETTLKIEPR